MLDVTNRLLRARWQYQPGLPHDPSPPVNIETGTAPYTLPAESGFIEWRGPDVNLTPGTLANIALRSQSNTTYASRTNTTITAPSGIADGDILLAAIFCGRQSNDPATPTLSGWTQIGTATLVNDAGGFRGSLFLFYKRASSESGDYTFTHIAMSTQGWMGAFSGAIATGSPIGAASANNGTGSTSTGTGITTTVNGSWLLYLAHDWIGGGALSPPSGMTERFDGLVYAATELRATAGATGNRTQTTANASGDPWAARMVELLPDVPAGSTYTLTADAGSYGLTGTDAGLLRGLLVGASGGTYTLTGTAAGLNLGAVLTAAGSSYGVTGADAGLIRSVVLAASSGSISVSGTAAGLARSYLFAAGGGSYAWAGTDAGVLRGSVLTAAGGTFAWTGTDATLTAVSAKTLAADSGSFTVAGTDAGLVVGRLPLTADAGAFALTGAAAGLSATRTIGAGGGTYDVTGTAAGLLRGLLVGAAGGTYTCTGTAATFSRTYVLAAAGGSFSWTGTAATLSTGANPVMAADPGAFALGGAAAGLLVGRLVTAAPGAMVATGADAGLLWARLLPAGTGGIVLTGIDAVLRKTAGIGPTGLLADTRVFPLLEAGALVLPALTGAAGIETELDGGARTR